MCPTARESRVSYESRRTSAGIVSIWEGEILPSVYSALCFFLCGCSLLFSSFEGQSSSLFSKNLSLAFELSGTVEEGVEASVEETLCAVSIE